MDSWYKIKSGMSEQHKQYMIELKRLYEGSLAEYKRQEDDAREKVNKVIQRLQDVTHELNTTSAELSKIQKDSEDLRLKQEQFKIDEKNLSDMRMKEDGRIAVHDKRINEDTQALARKAQDESIRLTTKENRIKQLQKDIDYSISRNAEILDSIKNQEAELSDEKKGHVKDLLDFAKKQRLYQEGIKNLEIEKDIHLANVSDLEKEKKKFESDKTAIMNKQSALNHKESELNDRERKQNDKDVEQELREMELNKKERRIFNLIEINKSNVKAV